MATKARTHWAFRPVGTPVVPPVRRADWVRDPLDAFVLARLEAEGLAPAPEADRATWLRRVSLDLCGVPPTVAELDAFVADAAPDAHARVVERLLHSPRYAERWAQLWLDLARHADTQGYEKDPRRSIWRWRDWLIEAIADDLPFDQFTAQVLAGDLLPSATLQQQLATAFHRNTMNNDEGGTDDEEFRSAAVVDRTNTTMQVWMGLTASCAQCHDHKHDPLTHKEYFQLYAFFDQTQDADRPDEQPLLRVPTDAQLAEAARVRTALASARAGLAVDATRAAAWHAAQRARLVAFDEAQVASGPWSATAPRTCGSERAAWDAKEPPAESEWQSFELADGTVADWTGDGSVRWFRRVVRVQQPVRAVLAFGSDDSMVAWCNGTQVVSRRANRGAAPRQELVEVDLQAGDNEVLAKVVNGNGRAGFVFELLPATLPADVLALVRAEQPAAGALGAAWLAHAEELAPVRAEVERFERQLAALEGPTVPVLRELPADRQRTTRIHERGNFLTPGEVVTPATPAWLPPMPADAPRNRLGLARWLTAPDNPLTARVHVNRLWEQLFGRGLVPTVEDFGTQGDAPSHPDLLDHLAARFRDGGWSTRELLRAIVLSATYRQSAVGSVEAVARDPLNVLLVRGPSHRLSAETLRDQALFVSGLLVEKVGGPGVMPPQPEGVWQQIYSSDRWVDATDGERHRRSLYTFWRRTSPHPAMLAFDAPSREVCSIRRIRTNTPLQALVTWNDTQFTEAARALAARVLREHQGSDADRVAHLVRTALGRSVQPREAERLLQYLADERQRLGTDEAAAAALARSPVASVPSVGAEDAAWVLVAHVVLNLDEFVTKP
ncbi:MAG: hypothetical protein RL148_2137 [Planctomycetota bacterium]